MSRDFEEWLFRLDEYHEHLRNVEPMFTGYGEGRLSEITGRDCWRGYFDDDFSPKDALDMDITYWD